MTGVSQARDMTQIETNEANSSSNPGVAVQCVYASIIAVTIYTIDIIHI
jgi:hypothetical protein